MANKRTKVKKPKQKKGAKKGGSAGFEEMGSPTPVRKQKKKK